MRRSLRKCIPPLRFFAALSSSGAEGAVSDKPVRVPIDLCAFVSDFAAALKAVDSDSPVAKSARNGAPYQPGIGPHTETHTVELVTNRLRSEPSYATCTSDVPYPGVSRQRCDLCFGASPEWEWAIELKLLRMLGDNGKPNDNMITHILSPYPIHRSAVTDGEKLVSSALAGKKAVVIFGYDYDQYPMEPAIAGFESFVARA